MKTLTDNEIKAAAEKHSIPYASLKAVIEVECGGGGFFADGQPKILLERHVFWQRLGELKLYKKRAIIALKHPRICNKFSGGYGKYSIQHEKLGIAVSYHREAALESCSWGLGQVMGYKWRELGYPSLQAFINDMYESEAKQLEAMLRFIKKNKLVDELQQKRWSAFAYQYNGSGYRKNNYDEKLAMAYARYA